MTYSPEFANHLSIMTSEYDYGLNTFSTLPVSDSIHLLRNSMSSESGKLFAMFGRDVLDIALFDETFRQIFDPNNVGVCDPHQYLGTYSAIDCFFSCYTGSKSFLLMSLDNQHRHTWSTSCPVLYPLRVQTFLLNGVMA